MKRFIIEQTKGNWGIWEYSLDYKDYNALEVFRDYNQALEWAIKKWSK